MYCFIVTTSMTRMRGNLRCRKRKATKTHFDRRIHFEVARTYSVFSLKSANIVHELGMLGSTHQQIVKMVSVCYLLPEQQPIYNVLSTLEQYAFMQQIHLYIRFMTRRSPKMSNAVLELYRFAGFDPYYVSNHANIKHHDFMLDTPFSSLTAVTSHTVIPTYLMRETNQRK